MSTVKGKIVYRTDSGKLRAQDAFGDIMDNYKKLGIDNIEPGLTYTRDKSWITYENGDCWELCRVEDNEVISASIVYYEDGIDNIEVELGRYPFILTQKI